MEVYKAFITVNEIKVNPSINFVSLKNKENKNYFL